MIEKILFSTISFVLFAYIFLFKMIRKNDTSYLALLGIQALGILINFIQIFFGILNFTFFNVMNYVLCIISPVIVLIVEKSGINFMEILNVLMSKIYFLCGNRKKAKESLVNLVIKYENSYIGHKSLADIYESEGGMRRAIDEYVKAIDIKANDYKSYYKICILLKDLGKKDESIEMLQNLLKKKPELYEPTMLLGDLLIENEKFKEAITIYTKSEKYHKDKYELYYNLGIAYTKINDFALAKQCYEKTVEVNNDFYRAYYRLGQIALLYRDLEGAEIYFKNSLYGEMESKSSFELAKIYMIKNQKEKAVTFVNKAIELNCDYYKKAQEEPVLFQIKKLLQDPKESSSKEEVIESGKEKMIEEYLNDTYNLTKEISKQKLIKENSKVKKMKWETK